MVPLTLGTLYPDWTVFLDLAKMAAYTFADKAIQNHTTHKDVM